MRRQILLLSAVLALLNAGLHAQRPLDLLNTRTAARVVSVVDGDTVDVVLPSARRIRIRLHGVDAPEAGQPFSQQARVFTRALLFTRDVEVLGKDVDVYGRLVARISVDGTDASHALIAAGLACTYRRYVSDPALDAAEERARRAGLGFWAARAQRPPCVARERSERPRARTSSGPQSDVVIGNVSSNVYHLATCRNAACKNCKKQFATAAEAKAAGFRPARDCHGH